MVISGVATIAEESSMTAVGGIIYYGSATISQVSGFTALGSLKWEPDVPTTTSYTEIVNPSTTWTEQSPDSTTWTDIAA